MKAKILMFIIVLLIILPQNVYGIDSIKDFIIDEQLDLFDIRGMESLMNDVLEENNIRPNFNIRDMIIKIVKGEKIVEQDEILKALGEIFFGEVKTNLVFLSQILALVLISAILTNLTGTFENNSVSILANYITYILMAMLAIGGFFQLMQVIEGTIDNLIKFMELLMPILLTFLVVAGGPNTKIIFHPMIIAIINIIGALVQNIIIPLIYFSFIVSILSNLTERGELRKLADLGRQVIIFIITAAFTLFIGIITIYGLSTKIDGLSIRTAKFALDQFVPIVGGFLSDAMETVIGSSGILKNGIGIIGLGILIIVTIFPSIKVAALMVIYKIVGAVVEPIVSKNISNFFSDIGKTLLLLLISLLSMAIMFFITITIIVETGNSLLMLR